MGDSNKFVSRTAQNAMVAAMTAGLLLVGCGGSAQKKAAQAKPQVVRVQPVSTVSISTARLKYAGALSPYTQTNLTFENSAYVSQILMVPKNGQMVLVDAGDAIPEGGILAKQDASEFEARAAQAHAQVKSAQADVAGAQAKLSQALATQQQAFAGLTQAEESYHSAEEKLAQSRAARRQAVATLGKAAAERNDARKNFERASILYHEDAMVKPDFDRQTADFEVAVANTAAARAQISQATADIGAAEAQARTAQAQIASAQAQVKSAEAQVAAAQQSIDAAQANLEGAKANDVHAQVALSHCTLKAPTHSVVVSRSVSVGTLAGPSSAAFVVADMRRMKAVFGVPDVEVDQLHVGGDTQITLEAFPDDVFKGHLTSISPSADAKGRTFDVQVLVDNPQGKLKSGMIANIVLQNRSHAGVRKALSVPLSALMRSPRNMDAYAAMVVVNENGKDVARIRDVKIGKAVGNQVEILSGLEPTDRVVVGGNNLVPDGEDVQIQKDETSE